MTNIDHIRFAHWIDLHELNHIGIGSEAMWNELEALEETARALSPVLKVGDTVRVRWAGMPITARVSWLFSDGFSFGAWVGYQTGVFTLDDLMDIEDND
jgi:hypothetical protein